MIGWGNLQYREHDCDWVKRFGEQSGEHESLIVAMACGELGAHAFSIWLEISMLPYPLALIMGIVHVCAD